MITVNQNTEVLGINLQFGVNHKFMNDILDILNKSDSDVPFTVNQFHDIENDNKSIRIEIYYPTNTATQTPEQTATEPTQESKQQGA